MSKKTKDTRYQLTLYLDTPKPMMRPFKDFFKHNQLASFITYGTPDITAVTGHAFIGLTDKDGKEERWGFTCDNVSGVSAVRGTPGFMKQEEPDTYYNEAIVWKVSRRQYEAARAKIEEEKKAPGTYKLFEKNCSTVATGILQAAGVEDMPTGKLGLSPHGLVLKKRLMLMQRRMEVLKFKAKNLVNSLFGGRKAPKSELLKSLKSKPIPVPINDAMKICRQEQKEKQLKPFDLTKVLASIGCSGR